MEEKNPIKSAERIFNVMELLCEEGPMGVTEIGVALNLNKSTVHRLLMSLSTMGYVNKLEKSDQYAMTYKLLRMAEQVKKQQDVLRLLHPLLKKLSQTCSETVHLVQRSGDMIIYIDKVESRVNSVQMVSQIGLAHSIFTTGVGKAMLAELPKNDVINLWDNHRITPYTKYTITNKEEFLRELELTRERGYALDNQENELGVRCIAASIYNYDQNVEYAFSISVPISRMSDERVAELSEIVLEYRKQFSALMGTEY